MRSIRNDPAEDCNRPALCVQEKEQEPVDGTKWAVSLCTVDGQRYRTQCSGLFASEFPASQASFLSRLSLGDWADPLPLAEVSWPLVYGAAVDLLGSELIHRYVGMDGYSAYDSPFTLTKTGPVDNILIFRYWGVGIVLVTFIVIL